MPINLNSSVHRNDFILNPVVVEDYLLVSITPVDDVRYSVHDLFHY